MIISPTNFLKNIYSDVKDLPQWQRWFLLIATLHVLFIFFFSIDSSVHDRHAWRQSQVGISAFWILQGGPWLAYETPVLGHPWSIPFEFPVYQLLVAGLAKLAGLSIDVSGRMISFIFYLAVLPLAWRLARHFKCGSPYLFVFSALYLMSPFYVFWGRTVMIESTAVFFSLAWLTGLILYFSNNNIRTLIIVIVVGILAALTKITTFFVFAIAGGIYMLYWLGQQRRLSSISAIKPLLISLVMVLIPLSMMIFYTDFADGLKQAHPNAHNLTSKELLNWNYGTLQQRLDYENWWRILYRMLRELIGYGSFILLIGIFFVKWKKSELVILGSLIIIYLSAFLVFFNLHHHHDYYQYGNNLFMLAIFSWVMSKLFSRFKTREMLIVFSIVGMMSVSHFYNYYFPSMGRNDFFQVTDYVRSKTQPEQSIIVLGYGWAPLVAYYSQRKSLSVRGGWLDNPTSFLGGMPLGAVVVGNETKVNYDELKKFIAGYSEVKMTSFVTSIGKTYIFTGFENKVGK
jgi:4-amino-4-deoxy-L-arabinose transferase-like glycosyltransferase